MTDQAPDVRIGLISDTHGWLDPAAIEALAGVDLICHAGDIGTLAVLEALEAVAPVAAVRGNVDGGALHDLPEELVLELAGKRLAMRHIAGSPQRPNPRAAGLIDRESPDFFVCGHTHVAVAARLGGTLWINPGAAGREGPHDTRLLHILELPAAGDPRLLRVILGSRSRR
jgi:putative phosphoesterase